MKNSCTNGRHDVSLPRCTGPHLQPSTPALLKSIPLASSGPHSFHIGARFQHETKLSCLWEESKITTRVSVLKAAGCYRAVTKSDPCRCEPLRPRTTVAVCSTSESINDRRENFFFFLPSYERGETSTSATFLLIAFCLSDSSPQTTKWGGFRNSSARKWKRCRSSRRTEDIWWSSVR